jgi:hypothetical protein
MAVIVAVEPQKRAFLSWRLWLTWNSVLGSERVFLPGSIRSDHAQIVVTSKVLGAPPDVCLVGVVRGETLEFCARSVRASGAFAWEHRSCSKDST